MKIFIINVLFCLLISIAYCAVTLSTTSSSYTLSNGYATVVISRSSGFITSLKYGGSNQEYLNKSYIDANGGKVYFAPNKNSVIKNTSSHVEVSFYDAYQSGSGLALDWEARYTMLSDTRGVYFSLTHSHKSNYPATSYGEVRLVLKLKSNIFNWLQVSDEVGRYMPTAAEQSGCTEMGPKEACKMKNGEVIHKYDFSVDMLKHNVHGFASSTTGLGCWFVSPSMEWKNGGAYNRDLSCHQGGNDSVQIMYMAGSHYGAGDTPIPAGENWTKVFGPYLIYLNKAGSPQQSWNDAKAKASAEGKLWPYSFVSQPGYVKDRGKVTGTLCINNPLTNTRLPLEDAVVVLTQPQSSTEPIPNQQWRKTSHWAHSLSGNTPTFIIYDVVPGTYQLHAWSKNVVGEFIKSELVTVKAGETVNLGKFTFNENRIGPIAWEIGVPDRTAMEYRHGNEFNQWGHYHKFAEEFPNSVNFYVGKSNIAKDWNYCQVSIPGGAGGKYQQAPWNIYFDMKSKPSGTSVLRVSIAASSYSALSISLNDGKASAEVKDLIDDAAIRRDGIRGIYRELEFKFEPSSFKIGQNKFTLYSRKTGGYQTYYSYDGIMYDHIRLEVPGYSSSNNAVSEIVKTTANAPAKTTVRTTIKTTTTTTTTKKAVTTTVQSNESCVAVWGQCGGNNYSGSTKCCQGKCNVINEWYHQCVN